MTGRNDSVFETAAALRRDFDQAFSRAPADAPEASIDLLAVRLNGVPHAVHLSEVAGLYADRKVIPVPCQFQDLLGIASFRNLLVPIYDLRMLMGYPGASPPRWLILARGSQPVGFAFDGFDGHVRASRAELSADSDGRSVHLRGSVLTGTALSILYLASLIEAIAGRVLPPGALKER